MGAMGEAATAATLLVAAIALWSSRSAPAQEASDQRRRSSPPRGDRVRPAAADAAATGRRRHATPRRRAPGVRMPRPGRAVVRPPRAAPRAALSAVPISRPRMLMGHGLPGPLRTDSVYVPEGLPAWRAARHAASPTTGGRAHAAPSASAIRWCGTASVVPALPLQRPRQRPPRPAVGRSELHQPGQGVLGTGQLRRTEVGARQRLERGLVGGLAPRRRAPGCRAASVGWPMARNRSARRNSECRSISNGWSHARVNHRSPVGFPRPARRPAASGRTRAAEEQASHPSHRGAPMQLSPLPPPADDERRTRRASPRTSTPAATTRGCSPSSGSARSRSRR